MRTAIETDLLTKSFRMPRSYRNLLLYPWRQSSRVAVDGISIQIGQGELFGLLGQNGAGKTTLIKMLCTALLPTSGRAYVAGYDVVREARQVRGAIGLVSGEERSFYWRLSGRQNLEFFAALYHVPPAQARQRIERLLHGVGLEDSADQPFRTYSTGMRQKLAIARGLLNQPRVLFMDEPTRSLDPISAQSIRRFVREHIIGELGSAVVLATHSMSEAEELCDRMALIRAGKIVAQGTVAQLRETLHYGLRRVLTLRHMPPELPDLLRSFVGVSELIVSHASGAQTLDLRMADDGALLAAILRATVESGAEIYDCVTHQASLEEIYLHTLSVAQPVPNKVVLC